MAAAKKGIMDKVGTWAFIIGLVIALIAAIVSPTTTGKGVIILLGILGIVVGILNVTDSELNSFLIATLAFMVSASSLSALLGSVAYVVPFLNNIVYFVAPGAAVLAIKAIYDISKDA